MKSQITREAAWELLRKYNKDSFCPLAEASPPIGGGLPGMPCNWALPTKWISGEWSDCCTTLTLSSIPRSIASRLRNCCAKEA